MHDDDGKSLPAEPSKADSDQFKTQTAPNSLVSDDELDRIRWLTEGGATLPTD